MAHGSSASGKRWYVLVAFSRNGAATMVLAARKPVKLVDDASYDAIEAELAASLRQPLLALRRDALEELSWE